MQNYIKIWQEMQVVFIFKQLTLILIFKYYVVALRSIISIGFAPYHQLKLYIIIQIS